MYKIFSEDKHGKQMITVFATNNYNPIFHYKYKLNTATYNFFHSEKKDKLELEKPTSLSVLE